MNAYMYGFTCGAGVAAFGPSINANDAVNVWGLLYSKLFENNHKQNNNTGKKSKCDTKNKSERPQNSKPQRIRKRTKAYMVDDHSDTEEEQAEMDTNKLNNDNNNNNNRPKKHSKKKFKKSLIEKLLPANA